MIIKNLELAHALILDQNILICKQAHALISDHLRYFRHEDGVFF